MGERYADVVVACLAGLEEERDGDGIVVGTAFVTRVIRKLEEISM